MSSVCVQALIQFEFQQLAIHLSYLLVFFPQKKRHGEEKNYCTPYLSVFCNAVSSLRLLRCWCQVADRRAVAAVSVGRGWLTGRDHMSAAVPLRYRICTQLPAPCKQSERRNVLFWVHDRTNEVRVGRQSRSGRVV
jgi:hypothetical protein